MSWNVARLGGDTGALDRAVRAADPDVLVVNEGPRRPLLWRRDVAALCRRWGLAHAAGGPVAGSNLVLVRPGLVVRAREERRLPQPRLAPRRGVVSVRLELAGRSLGVVGCHLGLRRDSRLREVEQVLRAADALPGPVVLAGDLNEPPDGPCWRRLQAAGFKDTAARGAEGATEAAATFPADRPRSRIDAVLVRGDELVLRPERGSLGPALPDAALLAVASDHRPVLVRLTWRGTRP